MEFPLAPKPSFNFPSKYLLKGGLLFGSITMGQWFLSDVVHVPGGLLGTAAAGSLAFLLLKPNKTSFKSPSSVKGWLKRCNEVIADFEALEEKDAYLKNNIDRQIKLRSIIIRDNIQQVALINSNQSEYSAENSFIPALNLKDNLSISFTNIDLNHYKLDSWPSQLNDKDAIIYFIRTPLKASDLLILEHVPEDQPCWILVTPEHDIEWLDQLKALQTQLPKRWSNQILNLNQEISNSQSLKDILRPIRKSFSSVNRNIDNTKQRLLSSLHLSFQSDLEVLRRSKFQSIQNRTQWIVAGAVFASPLPSTDLLALSVVNGLMINEMAQIWSCKWQPETIQMLAKQLAIAALAQGVVEWSGQALLSMAKFHGTSWVAAGSIQALSAAYLTRVVGRSMSDWMAISNGLTEPDLEAFRTKVPELVANAAKEEKLNWKSFLDQAKIWTQSNELSISRI